MSETSDMPMAKVEPASSVTQTVASRGPLWRTPWYHGWNVIAVSLLVQTVLNAGGLVTFTFLIQPWSQDFGVTASKVVLASTFMSIGVTASGPFVGRLLDSTPIRVMIAAGVALFAMAFVLAAQATHAWHILALYAIPIPIALGAACTLPAQVLAARWFPERRGLAIGIVNLGFPFPAVIGPPMIAAAIVSLGWRPMFQIFALAAAVLIPFVLLVIRNGPAQHPSAPAAGSEGAPPPSLPPAVTVRQILGTRSFWLLIVVGTLILAAFGGWGINFVPLAAERGLDPKAAAGLLSVLALLGAATLPLWGHLGDKVEHRYLFAGSAAAGALCFLGVAFAKGFVALAVTTVLLGLSLSGILPLIGVSLAYQFGAASLGRAMGLGSLSIFLSSFGAPMTAKLHEMWGSFTPAFVVLAGICALAAVAAWFLRYPRAA
jgi:MFS family permease